MTEATEIPNLGLLRLNDEDVVDTERPKWVRRAQEEWSQASGGFPRGSRDPVLAFLVEGDRHGTEWYLPTEPSIRLSIASSYFHVGEGAPRRVSCFLAIPEYTHGNWVLGRVFLSLDSEVEDQLIRAVIDSMDASREGDGFDLAFDPGEMDAETGATCATTRFAACLDGSNTMYKVKRFPGEAVVVSRTTVGHGNSVDYEKIVVSSSGEVVRRASSRRRCPFCAARGVPCECTRSFRERSLMDRIPSKSWEDFVSRCRGYGGDTQTLFDLRIHTDGCEVILPFRQTSSFHLHDDEVLREMRFSLLRLTSKASIRWDLRLDLIDTLFDFGAMDAGASMRTHGMSDNQSIASESKLLCTDCGRSFATLSNMVRHKRTTHGLGTPLECEQCEKTFSQRTNLVRHRITVHEGRRDFACQVCSARFSTPGNLSRHESAKHRSDGIGTSPLSDGIHGSLQVPKSPTPKTQLHQGPTG